jgi:hypothetical protein
MRSLLPQLAQEFGVHLLTSAFIKAEEHAKFRSVRMNSRTLLWHLLRLDLSPDERASIFPGKFELGNGRSLTAAKDLLDAVSGITGHRRDEHFKAGAAHAYKVAALVHRMKRRERLTELIAILKPPTEATASLELTNPYGAGASSKLRMDYQELLAYLSAEISPERLDAIERTFGQVRERIDEAIFTLRAVLANDPGLTPPDAAAFYSQAALRWARTCTSRPRVVLRADEQLFVHMHVLDFLHFAEVDKRLHAERPQLEQVAPLGPRAATLRATKVPVEDPTAWREFHADLSTVTGEVIEAREFRDNLEPTCRVLRRRVALASCPPASEVDALTCVAAMIVARHLRKKSPEFITRLHGTARGQTTSVRRAMARSPWEVEEELNRFVDYSVDAARFALAGQRSVYEAQMDFQAEVLVAARKVLETHDTDAVENLFNNLDGFARGGVHSLR